MSSIGRSILSGSRSPLLKMAEEIAWTHHERWDGKGYLSGLTGDEIPLSGRIVAVADVFDALTHTRPYKEAWPVDDAVAQIVSESGTHFDPLVVDAFRSLDKDGSAEAGRAARGPSSCRVVAGSRAQRRQLTRSQTSPKSRSMCVSVMPNASSATSRDVDRGDQQPVAAWRPGSTPAPPASCAPASGAMSPAPEQHDQRSGSGSGTRT